MVLVAFDVNELETGDGRDRLRVSREEGDGGPLNSDRAQHDVVED